MARRLETFIGHLVRLKLQEVPELQQDLASEWSHLHVHDHNPDLPL